MNQLLKNVAGQFVPFGAYTSPGGVLSGIPGSINVQVCKGAGGVATGTGTIAEQGFGLYVYEPTQEETNADLVTFVFFDVSDAMLAQVLSFTTIGSAADVVLAAVQPHYAPAKAGDAMAIAANQDIRNILGSVAGDLHGSILGEVPSPLTLSPGAVDSILDRTNGAGAGTTPRQAFTQLVAALVNVQVAFALSAHTGPSSVPIKPKFTNNIRARLGASVETLLKVVQLNAASPELGLLAPNLATACQQLATALDAVRTSTA